MKYTEEMKEYCEDIADQVNNLVENKGLSKDEAISVANAAANMVIANHMKDSGNSSWRVGGR